MREINYSSQQFGKEAPGSRRAQISRNPVSALVRLSISGKGCR